MTFRDDFIPTYDDDTWQSLLTLAREVEARIDYNFTDTELLLKALTVRGSAMPSETFERLEWLGDGVLDVLASVLIYDREPTANEGRLTKLRSVLTDNKQLARFSANLGLTRVGSVLRIGDLNEKVAADLFEAFIGAFFLDSSRDIPRLQSWLSTVIDIEAAAADLDSRPWGEMDPKAFLHQQAQKNQWTLEFNRVDPFGSQNAPIFVMRLVVKASGGNVVDEAVGEQAQQKKEGEKAAARALLLKWKQEGRLDG